MKALAIISILVSITVNSAYSQVENNVKDALPITIGERFIIESKSLDESRIINVYLPLGYSDSTKLYPVIYLLDGSMHEDFIHISGLVQYSAFPWLQYMKESIVVGISNIDRKRDFTYPSDIKQYQDNFPTSGGSMEFLDFIEKELQPVIESNYKVDSTRTIVGQSAGGLLVSEVLLKRPYLFDKYVIISPSLWWDDGSLLEAELPEYKTEKTVFIAVGEEGEVMKKTAKEFYEKLKKSKSLMLDIHYEFFEEFDHATIYHVAAHNAFKVIYNKKTE